MPFIDWNNNGKIDPVDIGISVGTEIGNDDDGIETLPSESPQKSATGCLATVMTFFSILAIVAFFLWILL